MITPDFDRCTTLATQLLLKQNLEDRVLNIQNLKYDKTIIFDTIQNYAYLTQSPLSAFLSEKKQILKDGCTLVLGNNAYLVLYNNQINHFDHLNWTLAHEIGHIYLGHTKDGDLEEIEAHFFAAQLFMPEYSLWEMGNKYGSFDYHDLMELFGVSRDAAIKRINTMNKKTSVFCGIEHKQIWHTQKKRVELYYQCNKDSYAYRNQLNSLLHIEPQTDGDYTQTSLLCYTYFPTSRCAICKAKIDQNNGKYCIICGSKNTFQWEDGKMNYQNWDVDENGRVKTCIRCGNEMLIGAFCHICGSPVENRCTDNLYNNDYETCSNSDMLPPNARYCHICGSESLFMRRNMLCTWQEELRKIEEQERFDAQNGFMNIPDGIDEELPFTQSTGYMNIPDGIDEELPFN